METEKNFKKLEAILTRTNIAVEWEEFKSKTGIELDPQTKMMEEAKLNAIVKVLSVGEEVKIIKPGQFALLGGAGRLVNLDKNTYGIVKEHMIDMIFNKKPEIDFDEGEAQGEILTSATQEQIKRFSKKTEYTT